MHLHHCIHCPNQIHCADELECFDRSFTCDKCFFNHELPVVTEVLALAVLAAFVIWFLG